MDKKLNDKFKIHIKIYRWGGSDAIRLFILWVQAMSNAMPMQKFSCVIFCVFQMISHVRKILAACFFTGKGKFCVCLNSSLVLSLK